MLRYGRAIFRWLWQFRARALVVGCPPRVAWGPLTSPSGAIGASQDVGSIVERVVIGLKKNANPIASTRASQYLIRAPSMPAHYSPDSLLASQLTKPKSSPDTAEARDAI